MGELNINDIKEGMELAEDIVNFDGTILLKAGSIITERHLEALRMWGVTEGNIKGVERDSVNKSLLLSVDPEVVARIDQDLSDLFQKTDLNNPIISEIYRLVKERKLKGLAHE
jgi:hypothetical protein